MDRKINIFLIYTLADKDIMLHLLRQTDALKEAFDLSIWHDDPIITGQPWRTYFESRIHHTDAFLLLVSDEFMNSQFIRQKEFTAIINRHNENKSVVIPVIIDNCKWDINLKLMGYEFNLAELEVLPEGEKPVSNWDASEEVYQGIVAPIRSIIASFVETLNQEEYDKEKEQKDTNDISGEDVEIGIADNEEAKRVTGEDIGSREEIEAGEENRLWEEAEAKRRAEFAKRIKEEAEASAKRRAEEDRLWEEALAKRRAEKEKKIRQEEEALATEKAEEKQRGKNEGTEKNTAEEKNYEETTATVTQLSAGKESVQRKEPESENYIEKENRRKLSENGKGKAEVKSTLKDTNIKKILFRASLVTILVVAGTWFFSLFSTDREEIQPILPEIKEADLEVTNSSEKTSIESLNEAATSTKLGVGDIYNGGIIFEINHARNTGKIAHLEDAGPMMWTNAAKIHEELGEGWRLPTFDELYLMYQTIGQGATNSGEFTDELYWSATAYDEYQARLVRFKDGNTSYHYNRNLAHRKFRVRAIRDLR